MAKPKNQHVVIFYDCPYTTHIRGERPPSFAAISVTDDERVTHDMRQRTLLFFGPGKEYGMHGDRVGEILAPAELIDRLRIIQINTTSFPANLVQFEILRAYQPDLDAELGRRAERARQRAGIFAARLKEAPGLDVKFGQNGYFVWVDASALQVEDPALFLRDKAGVLVVSGKEFGGLEFSQFVRINGGRDGKVLEAAAERIIVACQAREIELSVSRPERFINPGSGLNRGM